MYTLEDLGLFPSISFCFCPSCPFSHSPSTCLSAPPEKKEYEESILSYHEANEKMQYLEELSTLQSKFQTQAFAASDPMWRRWILRHGTVVVFAPLLSSPCNTHPRPQNKRGGGAEISWAPSMATSFLDSAVSSIPCRVGKELLIAFPLINN